MELRRWRRSPHTGMFCFGMNALDVRSALATPVRQLPEVVVPFRGTALQTFADAADARTRRRHRDHQHLHVAVDVRVGVGIGDVAGEERRATTDFGPSSMAAFWRACVTMTWFFGHGTLVEVWTTSLSGLPPFSRMPLAPSFQPAFSKISIASSTLNSKRATARKAGCRPIATGTDAAQRSGFSLRKRTPLPSGSRVAT